MALVTTMLLGISRLMSTDRSSARPVTASATKAPMTASSVHGITMIR
jgi:hypothetical protein